MKDDILTYREMCDRESIQTLQRGMNYRLNPSYSVVLMSQRPNAPYQDEIQDDGITLIYEGHDVPKTKESPEPKSIDQQLRTKSGNLTQNGLFVQAGEQFKQGSPAEKVRVYEKLFSGVWSFKGLFDLVDYEFVLIGSRKVYRFTLTLSETQDTSETNKLSKRTRVIPTLIKKAVWERDGGKCVICGATNELHFDHDIPYSKGGTSISVENVRVLCARHNLEKSDKIK